MKRALASLLFTLVAQNTLADITNLTPIEAATSKAEFCERAKDLDSFRRVALNEQNRLFFQNYGGLIDGGVCWWHSRFQRSATYLAVFRPDLSKPNKKEAKKIISAIMGNERVVEIPGYNNLKEFSRDWESEIQSTLQKSQLKDGFIKQAWISGLSGSTNTKSDELNKRMNQLYQEVEVNKRITYQKLQLPGILAHSWLVVGMTEQQNGYDIHYIDSNAPSKTLTLNYTNNATYLDFPYFGEMVAYTGRQGDFKSMQVEILRYCNPKKAIERWVPKIVNIARQQSGSMRDMMTNIARNAVEKGLFHMFMKDQTLEDDELIGEKWTNLLQ